MTRTQYIGLGLILASLSIVAGVSWYTFGTDEFFWTIEIFFKIFAGVGTLLMFIVGVVLLTGAAGAKPSSKPPGRGRPS